MNKKLIPITLVAMMAIVGLQGCAMTPEEGGYVLGNALAGAAAGAITGAVVSPKGRGRRSENIARGAALGGLLGSGKGYMDVERIRRDRQYAREEWAREQARQRGSTSCVSRKRIDEHGRVSITEDCRSRVQRPGYQSY